MIAWATVSYIVDPGDILCLDPGHQVLDLMRTAGWDLETELPDSLSDRGKVGGVHQGDGELLLIADVVAGVVQASCSPH